MKMDKDFAHGRQFSEQMKLLRPDSAQKLTALLSDYMGADNELSVAFRLIFGHPLCVTLFLADRQLSFAEVTSLLLVSKSCLSENLAARANSFIRGYFNLPYELQKNQVNEKSFDDSLDWGLNASAGPEDSLPAFHAEATLLIDDEKLANSPHAPNINSSAQTLWGFPLHLALKPLLLCLTLIVSIFAAFKLSAICEPFGLCEKKRIPASNPDNLNNMRPSKDVAKPLAGGAVDRSDSIDSFKIVPPSKPALPMLPTSPSPRELHESPYRPAPAPAPVETAPLREEALW